MHAISLLASTALKPIQACCSKRLQVPRKDQAPAATQGMCVTRAGFYQQTVPLLGHSTLVPYSHCTQARCQQAQGLARLETGLLEGLSAVLAADSLPVRRCTGLRDQLQHANYPFMRMQIA